MSDKPDNATRRDFLKGSTATAVGASLIGSLGTPIGAFAQGSDTIKVGLIGCGGRGTGAATQALSVDGPIKLTAMGDAFPDHLNSSLSNIKAEMSKTPERVDVPEDQKFSGLDAFQKVLATDIDVVILATPPGFRPMMFEAAVQAGKHVFMEKPVATDSPGVRKVLENVKIAKQKNLKVGVGLQRHHQAGYIETIKRIQEGQIGDVVALRVYWNGGGVWDPRKTREEVSGEMEYQLRNWYYYNWLCGDHITEQHIHNLDVGNWVMDAYPVEANGMGGRIYRTDKKYGEIYDHHAVEFTYANGAKMFSQCRHIPRCWNSVSEHVHGTKGHGDISDYSLTSESDRWKFRGQGKNPYQQEHDDLFAAIRSDTPYNEGENGALSTLTSIMGRFATYSGKTITWEQAMNSNVSLFPKELSWDADPPVLPDENGVYPITIPGTNAEVF
ncbi:MAG TPA: Gfo/Idh/MocA family oxidoreductase [Planctomycetaceae bacterium]|nr:Gfo/Idh/MocA family oxidoreductase [Planctomycetaceae bacterium]